MKFSRSIKFNAIPDWGPYYLAYSNLKKLTYRLEKTIYHNSGPDDPESSPLIPNEEPDVVFRRALDKELDKICLFYKSIESEIFGEYEILVKDIERSESNSEQASGHDEFTSNHRRKPRTKSVASVHLWGPKSRRESTLSRSTDDASEDDDVDENTALQKSHHEPENVESTSNVSVNRRRKHRTGMKESLDLDSQSIGIICPTDDNDEIKQNKIINPQYHTNRISLKDRVISNYVQLYELMSFIQLNRIGFMKVLKKFDKIIGKSLKSLYMGSRVDIMEPFRPETAQRLKENINTLELAYARLFTNNDPALARRELILNIREQVVWERNTVWRELIGIERKNHGAHVGFRNIIGASDDDLDPRRLQDKDKVTKSLFPKWLFNSTMYYLLGIFSVFLIIFLAPINLEPEQHNCLAMLVTVSLLWATEVIPLFATALMIPFLCVVLRIVRSDDIPHNRLEPNEAAKYIFAAMWTPVILLMLGGLTIAAALSKYDIARRIATAMLSKAGDKPKTVLLTTMFVAAFASMWVSNIAASVLCFSVIQPLLRNLPSDSPVSKGMVLGIALASNVGGMLSPISSPQNLIAIQFMQPPPSWLVWFFITIPVGLISILLIWMVLILTFRPAKGTKIVPLRPVVEKLTGVQLFVSIVTIVTIILWCFGHQLEWLLGDMGVVAIIPAFIFFGSGVLTKEDFNNLLWTLIILAAGGLSLGKAVDSSGLLHTIAREISARIENLHIYIVLCIFSILIMLISTFVSHAIAALIILPLLYKVGSNFDDPHPNLLVMGGTLICTAAMGLPTSSFPNMTAIMLENPETGHRYLKAKHFITRGLPSSLISLVTILTVGYVLMKIVGM
ncbi:putative plasma membrane phosphate transporter pho87 [Erysiphe necator]|uniref:Putative plasma membrane phosphate transporter pho87 n=1 Tax=Uncinula necator TaxID=52586 RepID=A0A0B1P4G5_UNCNE|nr:putative plasma membrane phosphate transporter pho87 [Erysiphe necator]